MSRIAIKVVSLLVFGLLLVAGTWVPGETRNFGGAHGCLTMEAAQDVSSVGVAEGYSAMVRRHTELVEELFSVAKKDEALCGYLWGPATLVQEHGTVQVERVILGLIAVTVTEVDPSTLDFNIFLLIESIPEIEE